MFIVLMLWLLLSASAAPQMQQPAPTVQNGRVEAQPHSSIARAITTAGAAGEPAWVAWRVPMVRGERTLCSTWSNGDIVSRGMLLEDLPRETELPVFRATTDVLQLESGTALVVLLRIVDGDVERVRVARDDCPIDGGGRRILWLPAVTTAASVEFLSSLTEPSTLPVEPARRIGSTAVMAISLHDDPSADATLDRLLTTSVAGSDDRTALREQAARWTGRSRERRGFERLVTLLRSEKDAAYRRVLVSAVAETRETDTLPTLLTLARTDADESIRAEAIFAFARMTPEADLPQVRAVLTSETSVAVKRRAVRGLARRPAAASVPLLIDLARTSPDGAVRTEAVRALSQSRTPEAIAYLTSVLTR